MQQLPDGKDKDIFLMVDFPKSIDIVGRKLANQKIIMTKFIENVKCTLQKVNMLLSDTSLKSLYEPTTRVNSSRNEVFFLQIPHLFCHRIHYTRFIHMFNTKTR